MAPAKSFRELKVYQVAREAAPRVFETTKTFPSEERYALTDQIRRSSRAVKALGEAYETQSWLDDALDDAYVSQQEFVELDNRYQAIGGMLWRMIDRADDFCKHEPATDYRTLVREEEEYPITDH